MNLQTNISNFRIIDENEFQLENHNRVFVQDDIEQSLLPGQQIQDAEERDGSIEHIQSLDESEPPLPVEINSISDQTNIDFGVPVTIELLQNGITQNVQLIEIQAASQQQIGDTGDQLYQLLSSWDIAHLYKKFKDKRTTIETFKYFRYKHLEHYFDKNEVGEQIPFEHHLFKWQRENNFYEEPYITASIDATMETPKVDNNNEFIIFNSQNFNSLALNDILAKTRSGKEIIAYYGHNNRLVEDHRSTLVHLIVDYYINNNCLVGVDKCRKLVDEIINLFPTETKTTYFIGRGHFPPKGKLYDRFQNQKKKLRKMQRPVDKKTSTVSVTEQTQPLNIPVPSSCNGDDSIRIELKHLRTPWEDVVEKWTKIAAYRIHQITTNKDNNLVHIFEQWPLFKHPQAPELFLAWCNGWPLSVSGVLVLHIGALDESLIKLTDCYLCIKPVDTIDPKLNAKSVNLCFVYRKSVNRIIYHPLDPDKIDSLSPIAIEMLTEEIPQLLQNLLVSVERAICRVSLDDFIFPTGTASPQSSIIGPVNTSTPNGTPKRSLECTLKRSKVINPKSGLTLKRFSSLSSTSSTASSIQSSCSNDSPGRDNNTTMPLFCLGGSFPHIDSDEETVDDIKRPNSETVSQTQDDDDDDQQNQQQMKQHQYDIVTPRSIQDLPEKLLMSGIYLPGSHDNTGSPIIIFECDKVIECGLNCYEIATILLYYSTIPLSSSSFLIHLIVTDNSQLSLIDVLENCLKLIKNHIKINLILITGELIKLPANKFHINSIKLKYLPTTNLYPEYDIPKEFIPAKCGGTFHYESQKWREFFNLLEIFQTRCITIGKNLISVISDVKVTDAQMLGQHYQITRRQLHTQHRTLCRALMEPELKNLHKNGVQIINELNELYLGINSVYRDSSSDSDSDSNSNKLCINSNSSNLNFIKLRLTEIVTTFNEVNLATKRLEQLTEQRRERLRELARQRTLEDEMNEIITWIGGDGEDTLNKYKEIPLECGDMIRNHEENFEKFYFISMKHLAKGRDLLQASHEIEPIKETVKSLKQCLTKFNEALELIRENIEGASRLHTFFNDGLQHQQHHSEMLKLVEKIGSPELIEKFKENANQKFSGSNDIAPSTKTQNNNTHTCTCQWNEGTNTTKLLVHPMHGVDKKHRSLNKKNNLDDDDDVDEDDDEEEEEEEDHSKMADSGLGGCERCDGNDKLIRVCSCQSFEEITNLYDKSNNSDDIDDDCFDRTNKPIPPFEPNSHLYCHASNLNLPELDDNDNGLDPKTQKTLLLIMREMIGTERDYVRSLNYIIENYMHELLREDIPQAMRGQRNVVFGNVERIYEFHQQHFLEELERCENYPLKVGAAFLRHESKFYLYALYNKNKPKSDSLMSEYGTTFFKSKQLELNDKMDLASYLLKPVQRMGKYALLLQQLMKACSNLKDSAIKEIAEDLDELRRAEEMVRFQLRHGNDLLAMDSLKDCDVNVKEQGRLLRQNEFLVGQGRGGKKSLRQVFLFEELILFSKARRFPDRKNLDIYIYKNSIKTSDMGLTAHIGDSTTKFEIWFRKMKPEDTITLQSMSEDIKKAWTEEISRLLWKQACKNREIRMAEMLSMGIGNKPCLDIRPSQDQINDRSISIKQLGSKGSKLRNSFMGTLPEIKAARRPTSIISGSSMSSGASSVGTSSHSDGSNCGSQSGTTIVATPTTTSAGAISKDIFSIHQQKHHRSTTLVSQCSMESGIIADLLLTPEESTDTSNWTTNSATSPTPAVTNIMNMNSNEITSSTIPSNSGTTDLYTNDTVTVHL